LSVYEWVLSDCITILIRISGDNIMVLNIGFLQWCTQEFFQRGEGSRNSVEDRENGDLGAVAP
jgi:hypothetical protein